MISLYLRAGNGKCGVFIPYHSHQANPIPIPIPMKLAWRFPFLWESRGTHGTHGNSQYILISSITSRLGLGNLRLVPKTNFRPNCESHVKNQLPQR